MTIRIDLHVTGMMCQRNCGSTVESALRSLDRVIVAEAIFSECRAYAVLESDDYRACLAAAIEEIECVGFGAEEITDLAAYQAALDGAEQHGASESDTIDEAHAQLLPATMAPNSITMQVGGMSCAVCTGRVESVLRAVNGVSSAAVILSLSRAVVEVTPGTDLDAVAEACAMAVQAAGYECRLLSAGSLSMAPEDEIRGWRNLLVVSLVLTTPLVILDHHMHIDNQIVPFVLSTAVQFGVGRRFYRSAYKGLQGGVIGMDFLVVLGTTASYLYSVAVLMANMIAPSDLRPTFATGAMLLTFVTLGKFLESYAKGKTASALQALLELQPVSADRLLEKTLSCDCESIDVQECRVGDWLRVLPGARIPADGKVIHVWNNSGLDQAAYVDESALSGEPFPVAKTIGDEVYGSTVNQLCAMIVEVTAISSDTVLSQIVRLVQDAQRNKAPIQQYADRVAAIFAPVVVGLSLLTLVAWLALSTAAPQDRFFLAFMSAISVIVVACPCALGLATPSAIMVGTGVGAQQGLLIKGGAVLENLHSVSTLVMDKTGTLTTGRAVLGDRHQYLLDKDPLLVGRPETVAEDQVPLWLAACAEIQSEHPLAKAVVNAAKAVFGGDVTFAAQGVVVDKFAVVPGKGVECRVAKAGWGDYTVRVGSKEWTKDSGDDTGDADVQDLRLRGQVVVYVSVSNGGARRVIAVLGIKDPVSREARSTVSALQQMGVEVWMCTGDHEMTAVAVAREIGIDEAHICAGVTPEGKADLVTRLQQRRGSKSGRVAVVGDGINDAVALARADVGIAVGAGTQVAVEAADVVLVRSSLHDVVTAIHLSKVVFRRIIMNFIWAMSYNVLALPFAAGVLYPFTEFRLPPEFAGLMMAFSSVSVVTSSLLLKNYRSPKITEEGNLEDCDGPLAYLTSCLCSATPRRPRYEDVPTKQVDGLELV